MQNNCKNGHCGSNRFLWIKGKPPCDNALVGTKMHGMWNSKIRRWVYPLFLITWSLTIALLIAHFWYQIPNRLFSSKLLFSPDPCSFIPVPWSLIPDTWKILNQDFLKKFSSKSQQDIWTTHVQEKTNRPGSGACWAETVGSRSRKKGSQYCLNNCAGPGICKKKKKKIINNYVFNN